MRCETTTALNGGWHSALTAIYAFLGGRAARALWAGLRDRTRRSPLRIALVLLLATAGVAAIADAAYIKAKAMVAQVLLHGAWAASLADPEGAPVRPWPHADTWPVARLIVPRLGVDQIVLAGASGRTLAFGPGHLGMSAAPGRPGNTVLSGHRDTHFRFLNDLERGDTMTVTTRTGATLTYEVIDLVVAHVDDVAIELVTPQRQVTLVTCYPFFAVDPGTPYRFVVTTELVDEGPDSDRLASLAEVSPNQSTDQPTGRTREPEPYGSFGGAFASALAGAIGTVQQQGGLPGRPAAPWRWGLTGSAETFFVPREKVGLIGGRLVSQFGL